MIRSYHHLVLLINAAEEYLRTTPDIKRYVRTTRGKTYTTYRYLDASTKKVHEHADFTAKGQKLARIFELRQTMTNKLRTYRAQWDSVYAFPCPTLNLSRLRCKSQTAKITKDFFDKLVPQSNPQPIQNPNPYNGITFRSKSEREMAEYLDSVGVIYKYEPRLQLGDVVLYPDFVCFIPELGIGFVIEHFGMMSTASYAQHAIQKIKLYVDEGFLPSVNILFTYETNACPPTANFFESQIGKMLDYLCSP